MLPEDTEIPTTIINKLMALDTLTSQWPQILLLCTFLLKELPTTELLVTKVTNRAIKMATHPMDTMELMVARLLLTVRLLVILRNNK